MRLQKNFNIYYEEEVERFLKMVNTTQNKQGMAAGIMTGLINDNQDFIEKTKKLKSGSRNWRGVQYGKNGWNRKTELRKNC